MNLTPIFLSEELAADDEARLREAISEKMKNNPELSRVIGLFLVSRTSSRDTTQTVLCELLGHEAEQLNENEQTSYMANFYNFMCKSQQNVPNNPFNAVPTLRCESRSLIGMRQAWPRKQFRINETEMKIKTISDAVGKSISDGNFCVVNPKTFQECLNDSYFHGRRSRDDIEKFADSASFYSNFFSQRSRPC